MEKNLLIVNASAVTQTQVLENASIEVSGGKITRVSTGEKLTPKGGARVIDAKGAYVAPGFIDMHIHGYAGFGPEDGTEAALLEMSKLLPQTGVTAFCPTLYCGQPADMLQTISSTVRAFGKETGAHLIGYHLEGPFISPHKPGVMKPQDISPVNLTVLNQLYQAAEGHVASMTVAPELPGMDELADFCRQKGILLQSGHTNATYEQFLHGIDLGIKHATHLFNAMSPMNQRAPGAAGAILMRQDVSAEIIADGAHVHPALVEFLRRIKPVENIVLVTDALKPTGKKEGPFIANGEEVTFQDGVWKRVSDHVIAGSGLTMLQGVGNLTRFGYTLAEAVRCAAENPARLLKLNKGHLQEGFDADLVIFDKDFQLVQTLLA